VTEIKWNIAYLINATIDALSSFGHLTCLPLWTHCYLAIGYSETGQSARAYECLRNLRAAERARTPLEVFSVEPYEDATARRLRKILEGVVDTSNFDG
jgi:hypothetical protein